VIHVPAFGEEMNKSRHVVAATARRLAAAGHVVLAPDLSGTGESPAGLASASLQIWVNEISHIVAHARAAGVSDVTLWGLRLGCLVAAEAAAQLSPPPERLLLWQPVHKGAQQMSQFLRLLAAAEVTGTVKGTPRAADARAALNAGDTVEIAGYPLSGQLYEAICSAELACIVLPAGLHVALFEVVASPERPLTALSQRLLERWQQHELVCEGSAVPGDPFWSTQELGFAPALIDASGQCFADPLAAKPDAPAAVHGDAATGDLQRTVGTGITFSCEMSTLAGRLHRPADPQAVGVVIVVGGPQYRVGSHRHFLYLARAAAEAGYATLRFDYRGLGDSAGELRGFADVGEDIRSAIDALHAHEPAVRRVVLWGLCDAATAAAVYAPTDDRVVGLVLANPWVYSVEGAAKVRLKRYYVQRLLSRDFWKKLGSGGVSVTEAITGLLGSLRSAVGGTSRGETGGPVRRDGAIDTTDLAGSIARSLVVGDEPALLLLSGEDYTAAQFDDASASDPRLKTALDARAPTTIRFPEADHTFSREAWRNRVAEETLRFLQKLARA
jgi:exosortase A-associated hydrolase 1/exosortase A-associated hydrolase 2